MISKLPIISSPATPEEIAFAAKRVFDGRVISEFASILRGYTGSKYSETTSSGIAAYYLILSALKKRYHKTEVVLPAYTAGSLVVAARKAGLKTILCDISLADFNVDTNEIANVLSNRTLAVNCVHMFGIGVEGVERIRQILPPATVLVEDCAQSMGSKIDGRLTGTFGDISFFSFNRGKNLPLSGGGAVTTNSELLAGALKGLSAGSIPPGGMGISDLIKSLALCASSYPAVYGALYPVIAGFKETLPPDDVVVGNMSNFQASMGLSLMKRSAEIFSRRRENGNALIRGLKDLKGVMVPVISTGSSPVFNRLPILFEEAHMLQRAERMLRDRGIETSRMYIRPLHHMFDLGYGEKEFPHACYAAQRLLTMPTHPAVTQGHIDIMVNTVRDALSTR